MREHQIHGKELSLEEIKVLQMDVLAAIDRFCCANNIRYSMACGTLLGAIRHKGYIPWDDDIDIYVPRQDYKRLMAEFPETYEGYYKISSLERDKFWNRPYANAYDSRTVFEEDARNCELIGVNIDIFPVDDVPIGEEWIRFDTKRRREQKLFSLNFVRFSRQRAFLKNAFLLFYRVIACFYPTRKWAERLDVKAQQFNEQGYNYLFENCLGLLQKKPFPKELFDRLIYVPFENRQFKAFADYDNYLKNGFGNYMQLPPKEKQVSHHSFKAYWKK